MSSQLSTPQNLYQPTSRFQFAWLQSLSRKLEYTFLISLGCVSMLLVAWWNPQLRIPGSAIIRAALPLFFGLSMFPKRSSGFMLGCGATLCYLFLLATGLPIAKAAPATATIAFGPLLSLFVTAWPSWRLPIFIRCALAGGFANILAYLVRFLWMQVPGENGVGNFINQFGDVVFISFLLCGLLSGLIFAPLAFKFKSHAN